MKTYEELLVILDAWTPELCEAAQREGWDLFTTSDSTSELQIQRIDDPGSLLAEDAVPLLPNDAAAMEIVRTGTAAHHAVARKIIQEHFPKEWALLSHVVSEIM